jgi:predicted acylesterase/phospholipase RssA
VAKFEYPRKLQVNITSDKKIGLVLSGGGIKASAFHIGVCLALSEKGFHFSGGTESKSNVPEDALKISTYVGSSAGALLSAYLASGIDVNSLVQAFMEGTRFSRRKKKQSSSIKALNYWDIFSVSRKSLMPAFPKLIQKQPIFTGGLESLVKHGFKLNGLFSTEGIERYLRSHVLPTNKFDELAAELFIIATQLNNERKYVFGPFEETTETEDTVTAGFAKISEAVAASASLPPVFTPYCIKDGKKKTYFFDGEIRDTLSSHVAAENGCDIVIASYSIQPYRFNEKAGSLHDKGIPVILNQALYQVVQQKIKREINRQSELKGIYDAVGGYLAQTDLPEEHRLKLLNIIAERSHFYPNVEYVYIHPNPEDYEMFFADHFSLNPKILGKIVRIGFRSAIQVLRKHDL